MAIKRPIVALGPGSLIFGATTNTLDIGTVADPDGLAPAPRFYQPVDRGLEIRIGEKLERLRELDAQANKSR